MKPTAILVNTARGALVDEDAVAAALERGRLGAYPADVQATQPPALGSALLGARSTVLTPHMAALTEATYAKVCCVTARGVVEELDGAADVARSRAGEAT
jgi:phosphoglycerate dehydrogenase-like enzyme